MVNVSISRFEGLERADPLFHRASNSGSAMYRSKDIVSAYLRQVNKDKKVSPTPFKFVLRVNIA